MPQQAPRVLTVTLNPARDELVLVEAFRLHAKNVAQARHVFPGGKGFNVAKALALQGVAATALGFVGRPDLDLFAAHLSTLGVQPALVPVARTRRNLKIVETTRGCETELNEPGAPVEPADVEALETACAAALPGAAWVVLSGSVPPGIPAAFCSRLIERARAAGVPCLLDSSGVVLRTAAAARPALVHVNRHELTEWSGQPVDDVASGVAAARAARRSGDGAVLLSLGPQGAVFVGEAEAWHAAPPDLHAANPVGAGDALCAGWLAARLRGLSDADALRWATAVASASVLTLEPGTFTPAEAERLLATVAVRRCS
jgi:tagatose 6-phosphate kinase